MGLQAPSSWPTFSWATVKKHNTENDAWIVIKGYVYDVSRFLPDHPGGQDILLEHLGTDATEVFSSDDIHVHSKAAWKLLEGYRIGIVETANVLEVQTTKKYNIDINKPLLYQVGDLGNDYWEWVHTPIHREGGIRLFKTDFFEFFTRTPWWIIPLLWVPISLSLLFVGFQNSPFLILPPLAYVTGVFFWYFMEYVIHRWVFHIYAGSYKMNLLHFLLHGIHHLTPMDKDRLVFPPALGLVVAAGFLKFFSLLLPISVLHGFVGGLILGYMSYDLTHYYIHHHVPLTQHLRSMKTYHMDHHYKNPDAGYGITSKFYDGIFSTLPEPRTSS